MTDMSVISGDLSPQSLRNLVKRIEELDSRLDQASTSETVHGNAVERELVAAHGDSFSDVISQITDYAGNLSEEQRAAYVLAVQTALEETYGGETEKFVSARAKTRIEQAQPLTEEEAKKVREERKELSDAERAMRQLLSLMGMDVDSIPKPKIRRGSRGGTRKKRRLSQFDYRIGNVPIESDGLGAVAKVFGFDKVSELRSAIETAAAEQGDPLDLKSDDLPDDWSVAITHPTTGDTVTLYATRQEEYRTSEDAESEDSDVVDDEDVEDEE